VLQPAASVPAARSSSARPAVRAGPVAVAGPLPVQENSCENAVVTIAQHSKIVINITKV
jgi:hypothetical protein